MIKDPEIKQYCDLYKNGWSMRKICRKFDRSVSTVKKYLLLNNIKVKTNNLIYNLRLKNDLLIGIFIGIWCGDGCKFKCNGYNVKISCHSDNTELIKFIQQLILRIFGKTSWITFESSHGANIIFKSKFIFEFIDNYTSYHDYKSKTIRLKEKLENYNDRFIDGFFLGLMLSDGYLKNKLVFNSISIKLSKNMQNILVNYDYHPRRYIHLRAKYGWNDLYMVSLNTHESIKALIRLDNILERINYDSGFSYLKGYKF